MTAHTAACGAGKGANGRHAVSKIIAPPTLAAAHAMPLQARWSCASALDHACDSMTCFPGGSLGGQATVKLLDDLFECHNKFFTADKAAKQVHARRAALDRLLCTVPCRAETRK